MDFDDEFKTWMAVMDDLPVPLAHFPLVYFDTGMAPSLFAIGGQLNGAGVSNTIYKYDIAANVWSFVANMTLGRHKHCAVVDNGEIWIVGGHE